MKTAHDQLFFENNGQEAKNLIADAAGQENYRLLQLLPAAIYMCDMEGRITMYNQAAAELWGREPEIGKDLWCGSWKIYSPDGQEMPLENCPMAISLKESKPVESTEIIIERPDGSRRIVLPNPVPLFDDNGLPKGAMNLLLDVTERKQQEETAAHLASIVRFSDDAIVSKNLQGVVKSWNPGAERIFGYTAQEMIGTPITKIIPPDRQNEEPKILELIKNGKRVDHFETKRMTKDGRLIDVSLTISPVRNAIGQIVAVSKIARDISAQKKAEMLIRESEERFRMAVETTNLGTWEFHPATGELSWSAETRMIFGFSENDKIDLDTYIHSLHEEDAEKVKEQINNSMDLNNPEHSYEIKHRIIRNSDKETRWVKSQGKIFFNENGEVEKLVGTVIDITEEKLKTSELERQVEIRTKNLKEVVNNLQRTNTELEQFAYVASHDLKEPLRMISTYSTLLQQRYKEKLDKDADEFIEFITSGVIRMQGLINDLLDYSHIGKRGISSSEVDLSAVVNGVLFNLSEKIRQSGAKVNVSPLPVITGYKTHLIQLFQNLIENAIKFNDAETPEINIEARKQQNHIVIAVKDNGIGINSEYKKRIFTIFQRLHTREEYPGTGIGLAIVKKIVDLHGGEIRVESDLGKGSTFYIKLLYTPQTATGEDSIQ